MNRRRVLIGTPLDPRVEISVNHDSIESIQEALSAWFATDKRALPWRKPPHRGDAYAVLVSEVMLQQTRVETVVPYFEAWMERWPTVEALAAATEDDVLDAWQGLGFYQRARRLHEAAKRIVEDHGGQVPSSKEELEALPGVGAYTSAAVRSFAFGDAVPAVDGNTARVWARMVGERVDISKARVKREAARSLAPLVEGEGGHLVEALIELGAMVCTPRDPSCSECPLVEACQAYKEGRCQEIPVPRSTGTIPEIEVVALLVKDPSGRVLLRRRPRGGLLGGLWGLPMVEREDAEPLDAAADRCIPGFEVEVEEGALGSVEHVFSHKRWRVQVHRARAVDGAFAVGSKEEGWAWCAWSKREGFASSALDGKVFDAVGEASLTLEA